MHSRTAQAVDSSFQQNSLFRNFLHSFSFLTLPALSVRHLVIALLVMLGCGYGTANATLLGRLNAYYSDQVFLPNDEIQLRALRDKLNQQNIDSKSEDTKRQLEKRISVLDSLLIQFSSLTKKTDQFNSGSTKSAAEFKELVDEKSKLDDAIKKSNFGQLVDETISGVQEGVGEATFITSNSSAAIAVNAYRFNVLLWRKECKDENECPPTGKYTKYASVPLYIFLKKSTESQANITTLSNDLLDNEYGGTVNIKFSGGVSDRQNISLFGWNPANLSIWGWKPFVTAPLGLKPFDFTEAEPELKQYGAKFVYDFGVKFSELPPVQVVGTTATTATTNWVGTGYVGVGLISNFPSSPPQKKAPD
jgi:hypothetical protein